MFKLSRISLAILILAYVFPVAICPLDFNHTNGRAEKDNIPDIHCGVELSSYVLPEDGSSAPFDLTMSRKLCPLIVEPKLPLLVYSIFKIPKPT